MFFVSSVIGVSVLWKSRRDVIAKASIEMAESNSISSVVVNSSGPIIVIDNYDSFTYNLCQVSFRTQSPIITTSVNVFESFLV